MATIVAMTTSPAMAARSIVHLAAYLITPEARDPMNVAPRRPRFLGATQAEVCHRGQEARAAGSPLVTTTSGFRAASSPASAGTAVAVCLTLSAGQAALAGTNDILIGLDEKITYGPD